MKQIITLKVDDQELTVTAHREGDTIVVERDGLAYTIQLLSVRTDYEIDRAGAQAQESAPVSVQPAPAKSAPVTAAKSAPAKNVADVIKEGFAAALAPMSGVVKEVLVSPGDVVSKGQRVVVMEAMKMDVYVNAPTAGTVESVSVTVGAAVESGEVLAKIEGEGA